jgi:FKBP-type peptidyl-prolyl cis-trans isomerase FkpA
MRKITVFKRCLLGILAALMVAGCNKNNDEELKAQEMRLLQEYLETNNITASPTVSGLYYLPITEGTGISPEEGTYIEIHYKGELLDGTVFTTSYEETAKEYAIYDAEFLYGPTKLQLGYISVEGLNEGIQLMKVGGKAKFIIPSSLGMGGYASGSVPAYSTLIYTIDLLDAYDDPEKHEQEKIWAFLKEGSFENVDSTETGLYHIIENPGDGELFVDGNKVKIWYTGKFLDGRVFDSNVGGEVMTITVPGTYLLEGWKEGIKLMRNGEKGTLIIPYYLGYGEEGRYDAYGRVVIPPCTTLVFELETELVE